MYSRVIEQLSSFLCDEEGATAVEYVIMIVLIIVVAFVAVGFLGGETEKSFNKFVVTFDSVKQ